MRISVYVNAEKNSESFDLRFFVVGRGILTEPIKINTRPVRR